ncbi:MAG: hypothetical protein JSU01_16995 [Bacteroidetes bacterium]|nr:hypothetical protein [Bacteroidota bacterium]
MDHEFDEVMKQHSDAELIEILNSAPGDYQDSAMESARREFKSRNLSAEKIKQIQEAIEQEKRESEIEENPLPDHLLHSFKYRFWNWFLSDGSED